MTQMMRTWKGIPAAAVAAMLAMLACTGSAYGLEADNAAGEARGILQKIGVSRGICVLPGDKNCALALAMARGSELTLYVQLADAKDVDAARRAADAAGLYGTRIYVERGTPDRIHLADNLADAVVAAGDAVAKAEVLRVLNPLGKGLLGQEVVVKPFPEGADDWSHHFHAPDNNPQSKDRLATAPYITQFIAEPRYSPAPQAVVSAGGRLFTAMGHIAWHEREEPWLNTLVAVNGYNGTLLWKRALSPGIMVDRSTMIATPDLLYLADEKSCKLIDPATGKVKDEIAAPADLTGGTFWKWMALDNGILYALVGEQEKQDDATRLRRRGRGWPWEVLSEGYANPDYTWGFAKTLLAIDPKTKKVIWNHREDQPIDSRGLCMKNGRIFIGSFGKYLACLNATNGQELWRRTAERDPDLFKALGQYHPNHGFVQGWKSAAYARCSDTALYVEGSQIYDLTAISAQDGKHLWTRPAKWNAHTIIRSDGVYTIGALSTQDDTTRLDPLTGQELKNYKMTRTACTRATGSIDSILFRGGGDGTGRLDPVTGKFQWISPMRPSCTVGVVIANGHLYWQPWACDCNLQMFGIAACGPAGAFKLDQEANEAERLEPGEGDIAQVKPFASNQQDWWTYLADNSRSSRSGASLPEDPALLWKWEGESSCRPTAPVIAGQWVFFAGSDGIVRAVDVLGKLQWKAYTGGAILYPPTIANDRAFVGSADGCVYAFEAATGRLLWRFRAAPAERKISFYGALVSTWPVASGVLVDNGVAYLAAGINNYDGTHVYALNALTGKIKWQNNTCGQLEDRAGAGVSVQGDLLLDGGKLYLAGGSAASPAAFDINTGKLLEAGRGQPGREMRLVPDRRGNAAQQVVASGQPLYSAPDSPYFYNEIEGGWESVRAGNMIVSYVQEKGDNGPVWQLKARDPRDESLRWSLALPARPVYRGIAIDRAGRVVVSCRNGQVLCFGK